MKLTVSQLRQIIKEEVSRATVDEDRLKKLKRDPATAHFIRWMAGADAALRSELAGAWDAIVAAVPRVSAGGANAPEVAGEIAGDVGIDPPAVSWTLRKLRGGLGSGVTGSHLIAAAELQDELDRAARDAAPPAPPARKQTGWRSGAEDDTWGT